MSPVNSMFVCIKKKKMIGKSVFKMADIGKMLNIGADNRSTPTSQSYLLLLGMQRYNFFRTIRSRKFWGSADTDPIWYQRIFIYLFFLNVN